jgi:2-C-methyl-D-erythritol 2,4-cyclodiphosphate synthase
MSDAADGGAAAGVRTGLGWDSHRFKTGRRLILGGVEFEGAELGLDGHSDADVLTHAVMDALLGAAGLDDIGVHFPDTDGAYEGADSIELLRSVVAAVGDEGLAIVHVDTTVLIERPKVGPHRAAIRSSLADALGLPLQSVNVKASTGEGMGFVGRLEGAAALAVATLQRSGKRDG